MADSALMGHRRHSCQSSGKHPLMVGVETIVQMDEVNPIRSDDLGVAQGWSKEMPCQIRCLLGQPDTYGQRMSEWRGPLQDRTREGERADIGENPRNNAMPTKCVCHDVVPVEHSDGCESPSVKVADEIQEASVGATNRAVSAAFNIEYPVHSVNAFVCVAALWSNRGLRLQEPHQVRQEGAVRRHSVFMHVQPGQCPCIAIR